jgi:hypothetical protein
MAITAFNSPVSGMWPLGMITVSASGTPVALNINVGAQTQTATTHVTNNVRQVIFTPDIDNTGAIYILRKAQGVTVTKLTTNFIVAVIYPTNPPVALPSGSIGLSSAINIDDYVVDADSNSDKVFVTAVFG